MIFEMLVQIKTFIPEQNVWVSTVAYTQEIGLNRTSETMVFKGNAEGITDYSELYFESHSYIQDKALLKRLHEQIVSKIKLGEIQLSKEEIENDS